jgi:anti-anti-sigma factor
MDIREEARGEVKILALGGRLDAVSAPIVEDRLMALLNEGQTRLVLDFSDLSYISSVGLRVLVLLARGLQKNKGKLALAGLSKHIYEVFKISGFTTIFSILPTCDEAVKYVQAAGDIEEKKSAAP